MKIQHPVPHDQIWTVAYTVQNIEVFELRTENPINEQYEATLWHDEAPLGTAAVRFMDADLNMLKMCFQDIKNHLDMINREENVEACFEDLFAYTKQFLSTSGLLAPLAVIVESYYLDYTMVKKLSLRELEKQFVICAHEQERMRKLAEVFFSQKEIGEDGLLADYLAKSDLHPTEFPELGFGNIKITKATYHDRRTFLYDKYMGKKESSASVNIALWTHAATVQHASIYDIFNYMIYQYLKNNLELRTCKYCGKYFAVKRSSKAEYCDRQIEGSTKTCRQAGAMRVYDKKVSEHPAVRDYKRSYKTHNARIRYGLMTKEEFQAWSVKARAMRDLCLAGKLSLEEFQAWLEHDKL